MPGVMMQTRVIDYSCPTTKVVGRWVKYAWILGHVETRWSNKTNGACYFIRVQPQKHSQQFVELSYMFFCYFVY